MRNSTLHTLWLSGLMAGVATAALAAPPPPAGGTVAELVVQAERRPAPGAAPGDIEPELVLDEAAIQSYGVSTMAELLEEIAPQTRSDRGRGGEMPVILLAGRRISGPNEIRDLPTEAIMRVDILPEEAALKLGYPADQRVVNFVLKPQFRAVSAEAGGGVSTAGGGAGGVASLTQTRISDETRSSLALKIQGRQALHEDDRDLVSRGPAQLFDIAGNVTSAVPGGAIDPALSALSGRPVVIAGVPAAGASRPLTLGDFAATAGTPNVTDIRPYRTLTPATSEISLNGVISRPLFAGIAGSLNGTLEATTRDTERGLPGLRLLVPAGHPSSPFGQPVAVDRYATAFGPLEQAVDGWTGHVGTTFNKDIKLWRLSLTGAYDHEESKTETDAGIDPAPLQALLTARSPAFNPFGALTADLLALRPQAEANSQSDFLDVRFQAGGPLMAVPAGKLRLSFNLGANRRTFASQTTRLGLAQSVELTREVPNARINLDLPIASRREGVLPALGQLSVNVNAAVDDVSDFGALRTLGVGLNWRPITGLTILVSRTLDESPPSVQQLGNPVVVTSGARVFDYATGRTVDITRIDGGNRALRADDRDVVKVGINWKPSPSRDLTFSANYVATKTDTPFVVFPAISAELEAAFPARFVRNAAGDLTQVDYRPVNLAGQERRQLRWGFNYAKPLGVPKSAGPPRGPMAMIMGGGDAPPGADGATHDGDRGAPSAGGEGGMIVNPPPFGFGGGGGPPGGGFRGGGGGGGGPGGRGGGGGRPGPDGRLSLSAYHTVYFADEYLIRPGGQRLDFLDGAAMGNGGGRSRHEVEVQAGYAKKGLGARLIADWKSGTFVRGVGGAAGGDLDFSGLTTVNLVFFAEFGQRPDLLARAPWLRGSRASVSVTNVFDARVDVKDAAGLTPLNYQPDYLDPMGRVVRVNFRKLFR